MSMRAACIMMQRNEDLCLHPWCAWHGYLFGFENLYIIDHGSDDRTVQETLKRFEALGTHVARLPASADFREKGEFVTAALRLADATGQYDLLLPLDCDEFVVMRDAAGGPNAVREDILAYMSGLQGEVFAVQENFLNMLNHPEIFFALPYAKMFFRSGAIHTLDPGSHACLDGTPGIPTRLVYAHYHHKTFARQRAASAEKLRPYVDVNDAAAMDAFRGIGWHLVTHLQKTEAEYMALMRPDSRCIAFPALNQIFERLGIDPSFCDDP
jgi:hypothetical protein